MILKGSQRAGARQLGIHLLKTEENEHVEVHKIRGFVSDDIVGALKEAYAASRGTRCRQFLFSLSLNPPETERVPVSVFEDAIAGVETKLGLTRQPRVFVFHEKQGRRHAHCVWSRIDTERMRAINLPHFKTKLRESARDLYIKHGWHMPHGYVDSAERDPLNFSRAEWQQARRAKQDPRVLKAMFQECWAASDSANAFRQALAARGLFLARGDRRGVVAVDAQGEIYAVARWANIPTKAVRARFGDGEALPGVTEVRAHVAQKASETLTRFVGEATREFAKAADGLEIKRRAMVALHRSERRTLADEHERRWNSEARERSVRFRKGLLGLWDRVTGRHAKLRRQNEREVAEAAARDAAEKQSLIDRHLIRRRQLQRMLRQTRGRHLDEITLLKSELAATVTMDAAETPQRSETIDRPMTRRRRRNLGLSPSGP